jgi:hypothetical protein
MICKFLGHDQQWKVLVFLVVEKLDGILVQKECQGLDEGHVDIDKLFIIKVEVKLYQLIQKRVAQDIVPLGLLGDILQEDACRLNQLDVHVSIVKFQNADEVLHHRPLAEEIEVRSLVLL